MDAIDMLMEDHRKVEQIFQQLESGSSSQQNQLFLQLFQELSVHAVVEEQVVYPELPKIKEVASQAQDAYREHADIKAMLGEIGALGASSSQAKSKLTALKKEVQHHVQDEEQKIFPAMRKTLSEQELGVITQKVQQCKQAALTSPLIQLPMQKMQQEMNMSGATAAKAGR